MRVRLAFSKLGFGRPIELTVDVYNNKGEWVATEVRTLKYAELEDGEHFNFPAFDIEDISTIK